MNLTCRLFSCKPDIGPVCFRCGEGLYDYEFVQAGIVSNWIDSCRRVLRKLRSPKCENCGKRLRRQDVSVCGCCSQKCADELLPF